MLRCHCMVLDLLLKLNTTDFKDGQHALKMPHQQLPTLRVPQDHNMGKAECLAMAVDLLQLHVPSGIVGNIVEHHHYFPQKIVNFEGRFELSGDQDLDRAIVFKNAVELIANGLVVFVCELLACLLFVLNGDGLLPLVSW